MFYSYLLALRMCVSVRRRDVDFEVIIYLLSDAGLNETDNYRIISFKDLRGSFCDLIQGTVQTQNFFWNAIIKPQNNVFNIIGTPTGIRTDKIPSTRQQLYSLSQLAHH